MSIGKRIKEKRESMGLNRADFARKVGVTYMSIKGWEEDANEPTRERLTKLASALGTTEQWILFGGDKEVINDSVISVPIIDVKASAGHGLMVFEEQIVKNIELDKDWLRSNCHFSCANKLSVITASGDSMHPTIDNGDFLLVDEGVNTIRTVSFYVAVVNDSLYVKRFQKTPRNTLLMISDNSAYERYELDPDRDDVRVIGKVIYHWHGEKR